MNYDDWSFEDLLAECRRRGFLSADGKHIEPEKTPEQIERRKMLEIFMKRYNINYDQLFALFDLVEQDDGLRKRFLKIVENG